ncbi:MAG: hypothetical protein V4560_14840 [Bacteroidota bacterium]
MKLLTILILILFANVCDAQVWTKFSRGNPVTRPNQLPVANAGVDRVITLPTNSTTFFGSGTDTDGTISTYGWIQISGPSTASLTGAATATLLAGTLIEGAYEFQITVTDNKGATATDNVIVIVNSAANVPPVSDAGTDSAITLPVNSVHLLGHGTDVDGTIVSYNWTQSSGPNFWTIVTPLDSNTLVTNLTNGVYKFQLEVTDNNGAKSLDEVQITVNVAVGTGDWSGKYIFILDTVSHVSIAVFRQDSILVKSIVSDTVIQAGTHTMYWNATDDLGSTIPFPDSSYTIKIKSNNLKYNWDGVIGNSSDSMTGSTVHKGYYECMNSLAFGSTYGYYCNGYSEGIPSIAKFAIAQPQQKIFLYTARNRAAQTDYVATDGTNVYWGGGGNSNSTFVYGTKVSDDTEVNFPSSIGFIPPFSTTYRVIGYVNKTGSRITGLAVQQSGNYLFIPRAGLDTLYVVNKTTGALAQKLFYDSCRAVSVDGSSLWMVTGTNNLLKYTVNGDGSLTSTGIGVGGLIAPLSIQANGSTIAVADGGNSQQVKFFSNTTGAAIDTLGVAGGYFTDATVNNNKFYFNDVNGQRAAFIAYQSDGSFWVNDPGNKRVQHYDASKAFVNRIMSLGATYAVYVDKNNINKVFANMMEFHIDYTQPLSGSTGWTLVRNWGANTLNSRYPLQYSPSHPTTLSNGRTYGLMRNPGSTVYEAVEFDTTSNILRYTGVTTDGSRKVLCSDGSRQGYTTSGGVATYRRFPLTGFSGNNPVWSSTGEVLAIENTNTIVGNPVNAPISQIFTTTSNKIALYNYQTFTSLNYPRNGYSLGIIGRGTTNTNLSLLERTTHVRYQGFYPGANFYEIGNNVNNNSGGNVNILDRYIITSHHDEFWKNGQTNKFNFYQDDGMALGQFGTTRFDIGGNNVVAAAGMAGNALSATLVEKNADTMYLYHGDEGDHSAFHRWSITRLNTIKDQVVTVKFPYGYAAASLGYVDLMSGLPFDSTLVSGTAGWTRTPTRDTSISAINYFKVFTNTMLHNRLQQPDLHISFAYPTNGSSYSVSRSLETVTSDWKITGNIIFPGSRINGFQNNVYIDVLDVSNKVIATWSITDTSISSVYHKVARGNGAILFDTLSVSSLVSNFNELEIRYNAGVVTFAYGGYTLNTAILDGTANPLQLGSLKVRTFGKNLAQNYPIKLDLSYFKLYKDYL